MTCRKDLVGAGTKCRDVARRLCARCSCGPRGSVSLPKPDELASKRLQHLWAPPCIPFLALLTHDEAACADQAHKLLEVRPEHRNLADVSALDELPFLETCRVERNRLEGELPIGVLRMLAVKQTVVLVLLFITKWTVVHLTITTLN